MPANIVVALLSLLVAIVLYTVGTWMAFRAGAATRTSVTLLLLGVVFDLLATGGMAWQIGGIGNDLHTYLALVAMFGMALAGGLGAWGLATRRDALLAGVARWTVLPWALWVFVFVWGMVTRGAARVS